LENLRAVLYACALDAVCRQVYRELEASFESAIHRLRSAPLTIADAAAGDGLVFGPSELAELLFDLMYTSETIGPIPEVVHGVAQYPPSYLNHWFNELFADDGSPDPIVDGAFVAIKCNDDHGTSNPGSWVREAEAHPLLSE
jgi:hypothetical protein